MSGVFASSIIEQQPKSLYRELLEVIEFSWLEDSLTKYNALCIENFPEQINNDAYMLIKMAPYEAISLNNPIHAATEQLLKKYFKIEVFEKQCAIERNIILFDNNYYNKWFYNITYKFNNDTINIQLVSLGAQIDEISFIKNNSIIKLDGNDKELLVTIRRDALKLLNHLLMNLYRKQLEKIKHGSFIEKENKIYKNLNTSNHALNYKKIKKAEHQSRQTNEEFDQMLDEYVKDNAKLGVTARKPISEKAYSKLLFKVTEEDDIFINNIINVSGWGIYKNAEDVISIHDRIKSILEALLGYKKFWKKTKFSDLENMSIHNYIIKLYPDLAKTNNKKSVEKKHLEIIELQRREVDKRIENLKLVDEIFIETCFLNFKLNSQYDDMRKIYSRTKFDNMREYEMWVSILDDANTTNECINHNLEELLNFLLDSSDSYKMLLKNIFKFDTCAGNISQPNRCLKWLVNDKDPFILKIIINQLKKLNLDMSNIHGYYYRGFYNLLLEGVCLLSKGDITSKYIEILLEIGLPVEHSHLPNGCGTFVLPLLNNSAGKGLSYHRDCMKNMLNNTKQDTVGKHNNTVRDNSKNNKITFDPKTCDVIFHCGSALAVYCRSRYRDTGIFQELINRTICLDNLVFSMACFIVEHQKVFQFMFENPDDKNCKIEYVELESQFRIIKEDVYKRLSIIDIEGKEKVIKSLVENFNVASEFNLQRIKTCCLLAMHLVFPENNFCININNKQFSECLFDLKSEVEFKEIEVIKDKMINTLNANHRPKFHM